MSALPMEITVRYSNYETSTLNKYVYCQQIALLHEYKNHSYIFSAIIYSHLHGALIYTKRHSVSTQLCENANG